jgi:hypothetical protein
MIQVSDLPIIVFSQFSEPKQQNDIRVFHFCEKQWYIFIEELT